MTVAADPMTGEELVREVCREALETHLKEPYLWLRESDLVVGLVSRMQQQVGERWQGTLEVRADDPKDLGKRHYELKTSKSPRPRTSRIRTEVRLDGVEKQDDRTDIAVLKTERLKVFSNWNGVRDASLKVLPESVDALLEVKLCPGTYVRPAGEQGTTRFGWLNDLVSIL
jgi:hypothetical protein